MRLRVKIYGKVQGVFFRHYTKRVADRLGIKGWIRNCPNGSVEALFQGSPQALERILRWCKRGPSLAKVERVKVKREKSGSELEGFEIVG